ncbi:MAG: hypothetical protein R2780_03760 [Crocinitomicaceae bacterium]|nr:hypothetical protein [Crocinitomicaceae bacterium]
MKNIFFLGFMLIINSAHASNKWTYGSWSGTGEQVDNASWEIKLEVTKEEVFTVNYPDLFCGGHWKLIGKGVETNVKRSGAHMKKSKYKKLIFRETIETGADKCDQGAEIHLIQSDFDDVIIAHFYIRTYDANKPIARAVLKRG